MKQTVAAYIAKMLEQAGVKRIWGVTGDSLNGLSDSLNRMGTIDWMPTRHEEVAAFAAGNQLFDSGEISVKIDVGKQRLAYDAFMLYRKG
mgnify:CR=1 FL=1